jgi:hypothetical protein
MLTVSDCGTSLPRERVHMQLEILYDPTCRRQLDVCVRMCCLGSNRCVGLINVHCNGKFRRTIGYQTDHLCLVFFLFDLGYCVIMLDYFVILLTEIIFIQFCLVAYLSILLSCDCLSVSSDATARIRLRDSALTMRRFTL